MFCFDYSCVECNESVACDTGYCSDSYSCVECLGDSNCTDGYLCEESVCVEDLSCTSDSDCNDGYVCTNDECTLDTSSVAVVSCDTVEVASGSFFGSFGLSDSYVAYSWFDGTDYEQYLYDIASASVTQITDNEVNDTGSGLYGDYMVWTGDDGNDMEVWLYTISTGETLQITDDEVVQKRAAVRDDVIVWLQDEGSYSDIYVYNISTGESVVISENDDYRSVKVDWPFVVALSKENVAYKFDMTFFIFGTVTSGEVITEGTDYSVGTIVDYAYNNSLDIFNNLSVYSTNDGLDSYDVYLHNVSSEKHGRLVYTDSDELYPTLNSEWLGWSALEYEDYEIYVYNFDSKESTRVTDNEVNDTGLTFSSSFMAWYEVDEEDFILKLYNPGCLSCASDSDCSGICLENGLCSYTDCDYNSVCEFSEKYEDASTCSDCSCGDTVCDSSEDVSSCSSDCGLPACSNDRDEDGDGRTDYPDDPGCTSEDDDSELGAYLGEICTSDEGCEEGVCEGNVCVACRDDGDCEAGACSGNVCVECSDSVVCETGACNSEGACVECSDSDGGSVSKTVGITTGVAESDLLESSFTDECNTNGKVKEYYCGENDYVKFEGISCDEGYGCSEGACVSDNYCTTGDDCDYGWGCESNICVAYECNDGLDNDGDCEGDYDGCNDGVDAYGACWDGASLISCESMGVNIESGHNVGSNCRTACGDSGYTHVSSDSDCSSPLDAVEGCEEGGCDYGNYCSSSNICVPYTCNDGLDNDGDCEGDYDGCNDGVDAYGACWDGASLISCESMGVNIESGHNVGSNCRTACGDYEYTHVSSDSDCSSPEENSESYFDGSEVADTIFNLGEDANLKQGVAVNDLKIFSFAPGEDDNTVVSFFKKVWSFLFVADTPYLDEEHSP